MPSRPGRIVTTDRTRNERSRYATSIANRIPKVCTLFVRTISSAPATPSRPSSPRRRARYDAATSRGTSAGPPGTTSDPAPSVHFPMRQTVVPSSL